MILLLLYYIIYYIIIYYLYLLLFYLFDETLVKLVFTNVLAKSVNPLLHKVFYFIKVLNQYYIYNIILFY